MQNTAKFLDKILKIPKYFRLTAQDIGCAGALMLHYFSLLSTEGQVDSRKAWIIQYSLRVQIEVTLKVIMTQSLAIYTLQAILQFMSIVKPIYYKHHLTRCKVHMVAFASVFGSAVIR